MQKIKMSVYWMFMILAGCRLSHATQSRSSCTCNDQMKSLCVPAGENVSVPCPEFPLGEEMQFNLFKNGETIYIHTCTRLKNVLNCTSRGSEGVEVRESTDNKSISFMLTGVNATNYGLFRCEGIVSFPPPYDTKREVGVLVLLKEHHCSTDCSREPTVAVQHCQFHWVWIIALVSIYSIIVTIAAVVFWLKLRKADSQSDYMNTKPKPPRERRRKRGVQNPIPRHF